MSGQTNTLGRKSRLTPPMNELGALAPGGRFATPADTCWRSWESKLSREAMGMIVNVVSRHGRLAIASFPGSLWRRAAKSSGIQPWRRSSPAIILFPLATTLSTTKPNPK